MILQPGAQPSRISICESITEDECRPTEPFLKVVRSITPPLFGVDISPIVIYGLLSFVREIFLGQQGLIIMMAGKQG